MRIWGNISEYIHRSLREEAQHTKSRMNKVSGEKAYELAAEGASVEDEAIRSDPKIQRLEFGTNYKTQTRWRRRGGTVSTSVGAVTTLRHHGVYTERIWNGKEQSKQNNKRPPSDI